MPLWKYVSNRFLTIVENLVLGQHLSEAHTGFRAYSRRLLETIPFLLNADGFVFDTEVIAEAVAFKFTLAEAAVPTRYFAEASSVNFRQGVVYGLATLRVMARYLLDRIGLRRSPQFRRNLRRSSVVTMRPISCATIRLPLTSQSCLAEHATHAICFRICLSG